MTVSPTSSRNAGEQWTLTFLWRFSSARVRGPGSAAGALERRELSNGERKGGRDAQREYFGTKWRYSRRMTMVRVILVLTTLPVRMRPRIETRPVNGHFLSM